jgi:hypothetical protein
MKLSGASRMTASHTVDVNGCRQITKIAAKIELESNRGDAEIREIFQHGYERPAPVITPGNLSVFLRALSWWRPCR